MTEKLLISLAQVEIARQEIEEELRSRGQKINDLSQLILAQNKLLADQEEFLFGRPQILNWERWLTPSDN